MPAKASSGRLRTLRWPASIGAGLVAGVLAWIFTGWLEGLLIGLVVFVWFRLVVARPVPRRPRPSRS